MSEAAETLYAHAGGSEPIERFVAVFYGHVLEDPVLQPLFGAGHPHHVPHLAALLGEVFGGPTVYTDDLGGFPAMLAAHLGKNIAEPQRVRFVELFLAAADESGLPSDPEFRAALRSYVEFGSHVAMQNSHAGGDAELHPCQEIPRWNWSDA